jgi:hypothetical protein
VDQAGAGVTAIGLRGTGVGRIDGEAGIGKTRLLREGVE